MAFVALALALSGCASEEPAPAPQPSVVYGTDRDQDLDLGDFETTRPFPPPDEHPPHEGQDDEAGDVKAAEAVAVEALTAWANTDRDEEDWWADVSQHLSSEALTTYAYVDPANIVPFTITGDGQTLSTAGGVLVCQVPTSVGSYRVEMVIERDHGDWMVDYFTPPEDAR